MPSRALRRDAGHVYLPARFRRTATYPLLVVHDGSDFLQYAAAKTVLDNLIHRLEVAEMVAAFTHPATGWSSTPTRPRTPGSSPASCCRKLEAEFPLTGQPAGRCLLGASLRRRSRRCRPRTGRRTRTARWC